jgi:hypothetical protein
MGNREWGMGNGKQEIHNSLLKIDKSSAIADRPNQGYLGKAMTPDIDVDFCSIKTNSNC